MESIDLHAIPTVGYSGVLTSYITAVKYLFYAQDLVQEGYVKYHGEPFKVATMGRWLVLVSGTQIMEDVRKAKEDQLSNVEGLTEIVQVDVIFGPQITRDDYHVEVVGKNVTRNLGARFSDITDEISASFTDLIEDKGNDWTKVVAYDMILKAVIRTSNRLFVGLPLCRNPDYIELQEQLAFDVIVASRILNMFPPSFRSFMVRFTKAPAQIQRNIRHLAPVIKDRIEKIDKLGPNYEGKPNDLISWCLEYARDGYRRTVYDLSNRILIVNFAAIHSSSITFTQILYDMAVHSQYIPEIREEVEAVIAEEGWTKASMSKMRKLDSFMKESTRLSVPGAWLMPRKVVNGGFTFSNGLFVPPGATIGAVAYEMHRDEKIYPGSKDFDAFRFLKLSGEDKNDQKYQMSSISSDYIAFGYGRHACPGRFFAVNELKAMAAYLILNYDVKLPTSQRPANWWFEQNLIPNQKATVMFRKRL
ncbi:cytochrome P450 [Cyathus striatus]|nr:cytochrome P450 [Cyathus striatus]